MTGYGAEAEASNEGRVSAEANGGYDWGEQRKPGTDLRGEGRATVSLRSGSSRGRYNHVRRQAGAGGENTN
jgi:hypothetical protein